MTGLLHLPGSSRGFGRALPKHGTNVILSPRTPDGFEAITEFQRPENAFGS